MKTLPWITLGLFVMGCHDGGSTSGAGGAAVETTSAATAGGGEESSSTGGAPTGPHAMVRLGNFVLPDFLQLDVCFQNPAGKWFGPTLLGGRAVADGIVDSVRSGKVGAYFSIPVDVYTARLVEEGSADCLTQIAGLPDVPMMAPFTTDSWNTLWATGSALSGGEPFRLRPTVDGAQKPGYLSIRFFQLDPDYGAVDVFGARWNNPPSKIYDNLPQGDLSTPYTDYETSKGQPFFDDFDVRPHEQQMPIWAGTFKTLESGTWTLAIRYTSNNGTPPVDFTMCQDGVAGPRLCYPCGVPDCTNH